MCDDRPLPPNWESRFDPDTQRWFFVDHLNKKTSWDDPRPRYYSTRQRKSSSSVEHCLSAQQNPTPDTSYASLSSEYHKVAPSSPHENESDSRDEEFMEYLQALRAAYPDCKDRQLAKLMEKWLGDSSGLRKFLATYLKRKPSDASEAATKRTSSAGAQKRSSLNRSDSPHSTSGYDELVDSRRISSTSPLASSALNSSMIRKAAITESINPSSTGPNHSNMEKLESLSSTENVTQRSNDPPAESHRLNHQTHKTKNPVPDTSNMTEQDAKAERQIILQQLSHVSGYHITRRCTPRGSDPQLRTTRLVPNGPNRQLVCGPDSTLRRGPNSALLGRHTASESAVPNSLLFTDIN